MMEIVISNGLGYVWNVEDIKTLRIQHRIVGCLVGTNKQKSELATPPVLLSPQEIQLLKDNGHIRLVEIPSFLTPPTQDVKEKVEKVLESSYRDQIEIMKEERKRAIISYADKIVQGKQEKLRKKRKLNKQEDNGNKEQDNSNAEKEEETVHIDRDEVISEEIAKIRPITPANQVLQIFYQHPFPESMDLVDSNWTYPKGKLERCRLLTFKDLWRHGYYLTEASKFGGDFLVYQGDPVKFHSKYVVTCIENYKEWILKHRPQDVVAKNRLGTAVLKTVLLAWIQGNDVHYKSITRQRKDLNVEED